MATSEELQVQLNALLNKALTISKELLPVSECDLSTKIWTIEKGEQYQEELGKYHTFIYLLHE